MPLNKSYSTVDGSEFNNVLYAEPGELQSVLNDAATKNGNYFFGGWPTVYLGRGLSYTNPPYTIPEPVTLFMNGAEIGTNGQNDLLQPEPGSHLQGPGYFRINTDPYTESVLHIDSSKGKFSPTGGADPFNASGFFMVNASNQPLPGDQADLEGNGIYINATSNNITDLHLGTWTIQKFNNAVVAQTDGVNGNFANNISVRVEGINCNRYWRHAGDDGAKVEFMTGSHVQGGSSASDSGFDTVFYNSGTSLNSCHFWGHMEDPQRVDVNIVDGPGMKIHESSASIHGNLSHPYNFGDGTTWNGVADLSSITGNPTKSSNVTPTAYMPGEMIYTTGGVYRKMIDPTSPVDSFEKIQAPPLDISTIQSGLDATDDGEAFRHDGTSNTFDADGGTTSVKGLYFWSNTDGEFKTGVAY